MFLEWGIEASLEKVAVIMNMPPPQNINEVSVSLHAMSAILVCEKEGQ